MPSVAAVIGSGALCTAIIERLNRDGLKVATVGREAREGELTIEVDATNRDAMKVVAGRVTRDLGAPSVLVIAPESRVHAAFGTMPRQQWQRLLMEYLGTTTAACAAFVPAMVEGRQGCVITMATSRALAGDPGDAYLAAATGAVLGFTKSFALEVARHGVRVNGIAVGPSEAVSLEEIADTAAFLVAHGGFYVGQVLTPGANG